KEGRKGAKNFAGFASLCAFARNVFYPMSSRRGRPCRLGAGRATVAAPMNPRSPSHASRRRGLGPAAATIAGGLAALVAFEICLRPVAGRVAYPPGQTHAYVASEVDEPVAEYRQYREGLSVVHFSAD